MAIKSTIFKADLALADIDHGCYTDLALTLARHPSETDERMMMRLAALALNAHQVQDLCGGDAKIGFGAGLSSPDEPDVQLVDFTGRTRLWIEVGQPDEKPLVRACSKADQVILYVYGPAGEIWWRGIESKLSRLDRLSVWRVPADQAQALNGLAARSMQLSATVQEGQLTLGVGNASASLEPVRWK
ncbi:YaeQ family protein [Ottowia thiooxydans]|uniref:YaeQ family protein n=1 Tax=Ottowia thiooxydans TaxID=219182 RepID=UPI000407F82C|nr:YaeQ family protein [Ottowia thiooxydans]